MIKCYGSKWRLAPKYPHPQHDTIIEPFAGGAGYSLLHYRKNVRLYDKSPYVVAIWKFLIGASRQDILGLPIVEPGEKVSEMGLPMGAEYLIRSWLDIYTGGKSARDQRLSWSLETWPDVPVQYWGERCRQRIADHVECLSHWTCEQIDDYTDIPDCEATWHIDPPYQNAGKHYKYSANAIDFDRLGDWCKSRSGQVMVCENAGADWLPFRHHCEQVGANKVGDSYKRSTEVIWTNA
jgi:hypothetical protein